MPKLPDASNLSGVNVGAPRSLVDIPVPDYAGAANAVARGVADLGQGVSTFVDERRKRFAAQERFNTKMGLLKAEEAYAEKVRDLDPLDPDYVEKKKAVRRETFAPVLSTVKDPENRQRFEEETLTDYTNIGIRAADEHKVARTAKTKIDVQTYADAQIKRLVDEGADPEKARASVLQMIQDAGLDALTSLELEKQLLEPFDEVAAETKANRLLTGGSGSSTDKAAAILRNFEGFRATPYWDVNADRVGYGSDTITRADGSVVRVTKGMRVSREDAERDLKRRVAEFQTAAARDTGEAWNDLSPDQQAALTSVAYNYGSLPKRVVRAIQTGDANAIADAVESLSDHNGGVNRKRREAEAAIIRGGASIPASWNERPKLDAVLLELENDPAYLRLGVDQREKVRSSVVSRYEKQNKEAEKAAKIELTRSTVEQAVQDFEDRNAAAAYIKKTITDPETREDALAMLNTEYNRIDENKRLEEKQRFDEVYDAVANAVDSGDMTGALQAIPADLPGEQKIQLRKLITDGRAASDDLDTYNKILALKLGTPEEQAQFRDMSLKPFIGKLKPSTIEALQKDQEALKKKVSETGKAPTFETAAAALDQRMRELGIDTGAKAQPGDLQTARAIRRLMAENTQAAIDRAGRDLTPLEVEKVMDETFMQFRGKVAGWFSTSEETMQLPDVVNKYAAEEERLGMSPGSLINEAIADFQTADPTFIVTGEALNEWLKRKIDGAAQ